MRSRGCDPSTGCYNIRANPARSCFNPSRRVYCSFSRAPRTKHGQVISIVPITRKSISFSLGRSYGNAILRCGRRTYGHDSQHTIVPIGYDNDHILRNSVVPHPLIQLLAAKIFSSEQGVSGYIYAPTVRVDASACRLAGLVMKVICLVKQRAEIAWDPSESPVFVSQRLVN